MLRLQRSRSICYGNNVKTSQTVNLRAFDNKRIQTAASRRLQQDHERSLRKFAKKRNRKQKQNFRNSPEVRGRVESRVFDKTSSEMSIASFNTEEHSM